MTNYEGADNWDHISSSTDYKGIPGDGSISWKKRGYSTILELLMVRENKCSHLYVYR